VFFFFVFCSLFCVLCFCVFVVKNFFTLGLCVFLSSFSSPFWRFWIFCVLSLLFVSCLVFAVLLKGNFTRQEEQGTPFFPLLDMDGCVRWMHTHSNNQSPGHGLWLFCYVLWFCFAHTRNSQQGIVVLCSLVNPGLCVGTHTRLGWRQLLF
jgi:hypothetical protein